MLEASKSFLAMDAPRHTKVRGLVNAAFTPRQVSRIEEQSRRGRLIVDELAPLGECDFVEHIAKRMPMVTISEMWACPRRTERRSGTRPTSSSAPATPRSCPTESVAMRSAVCSS